MFKISEGGKKYIKMSKSSAELDIEKIELDAKWDGYYAVSTNSQLSSKDVLSSYHNLWRIEESFRLMKHYFETRPMFHWTPKRISGHVMLNFIALIFERYLENILHKNNASLSPNKIRNAINQAQKSLINIGNNRYISYAKLTKEAHLILRTLDIKIPKSQRLN